MVKKVVIIGAGPSGILLAHYLLRRGEKYRVEIYERRSDPRTVEFSNARTYPISLNQRGMNALNRIEGCLEIVKQMSVESTGSVFHQANGKSRFISRRKPLLMLDRTQLVIGLLDHLSAIYDHSRLNIYFNHQCTEVDFETKTAIFQNPTAKITVNYDWLVGADGAKSVVRKEFLNTERFELEQKYVPNDYKSIYLPSSEAASRLGVQPGYIHAWRLNDGTGLLLVYLQNGSMSGVITFPHERNSVVDLATVEDVLQFFKQNFPEVGQLLPTSEAAAFLSRPISSILTIRCNSYHYKDSVLLLGDAAHAMSPSLGQGCNSALEDAAIVDLLLNEYEDNLAAALPQFTQRRRSDAHAVVELSDYAFPAFNRRLLVEFMFRQQINQVLHQLFPSQFGPSLSQTISETTIPYTEILNFHRGWIAKVKRANEKWLQKSEMAGRQTRRYIISG